MGPLDIRPASCVDTGSASPVSHSFKRHTRVSHSKTRKGCVNCKKRKVKCDEQRPACFNCDRLQEHCQYLLVPPKKSPTRRASPSKIANSQKPAEPLRRTESPSMAVSGSGGINLVDLELFHTYSTSTYATLFTCSALRDFWRINVPRLAIQDDYLMGEILALAALHLAHHRPDQRQQYLSVALTHHQAASQKAMELLKNINPENAEALFLFSSLTTVVTLATPKRSRLSGIVPEDGDFEDWIYLVQGTRELRAAMGQDLSKTSLAPLFAYSQHSDEILYELETRIRSHVIDAEKLEILIERINSLRWASCQAFYWEASDLFFWLSGGIDGFLPLVKARDQEAWVVLAHFCPQLKKAETQWWLQSWADCIMRKIHEQLGEEHRSWILRPAENMGWIAPT
ncbi:hypothetical protein HG530_010790 [Fusarium avenaceum]|nr:hypothetical protein HG530_010790 [Fusarium avenaceum]